MAAIAIRSRTLKRVEALGLTIAVVLAVVLVLAVLGVSYSVREETLINPGEYEVYELEGDEWSTVYFSVDSTLPVTVCITDGTGISMLKSGRSLCFFKAEGVTHLEKMWRFPTEGPLYLVLVNDSGEKPARVSLRISTGPIMW